VIETDRETMYTPSYVSAYPGYSSLGLGGGSYLTSNSSCYSNRSRSYFTPSRDLDLTTRNLGFGLTSIPTRGASVLSSRGLSLPPVSQTPRVRQRTLLRESTVDSNSYDRNLRVRSPSRPRERSRDELIDSIVHTRTREHRPLPGMKSSTDYEERRSLKVDCDKVFKGIIIGNGETICNISYLKGIGVTHVLNTAEQHVVVNPGKYDCYGIDYYGFHVDDLPEANISRYFPSTTAYIEKALKSGGLIVVNCVMGWSRSASVVAAYLMMRENMTATRALEMIRQNRSIRPNAGFLQQLADLENTLAKRVSW